MEPRDQLQAFDFISCNHAKRPPAAEMLMSVVFGQMDAAPLHTYKKNPDGRGHGVHVHLRG